MGKMQVFFLHPSTLQILISINLSSTHIYYFYRVINQLRLFFLSLIAIAVPKCKQCIEAYGLTIVYLIMDQDS